MLHGVYMTSIFNIYTPNEYHNQHIDRQTSQTAQAVVRGMGAEEMYMLVYSWPVSPHSELKYFMLRFTLEEGKC